MRRKNDVLDRISSLDNELGRLKDRIPVDTNPQYDLWLRIVEVSEWFRLADSGLPWPVNSKERKS